MTSHGADIVEACPVCEQGVSIGVQCSLCHRWYHTAASGAAAACVPPPFILPFFCRSCCAVANSLVAAASLPSPPEEAHGDSRQLPFVDQLPDSHWVHRTLALVVSAESIRPSRRQEVQEHWSTVFSRATLRRLRAYLAQTVGAPFSLREMAVDRSEARLSPAQGTDTVLLLGIDEVDPVSGKQLVNASRMDSAATNEPIHHKDTHLAVLRQKADVVVAREQRRWLGAPLAYVVNHSLAPSSRRSPASSATQYPAYISESTVAAAATVTPNGDAQLRVSHVAVRMDSSDDEDER